MIEIIDIASCMIFPALYSTSQVCSVIFRSVAPRTNRRFGTAERKAGDKKSGKCATFSFLARAL